MKPQTEPPLAAQRPHQHVAHGITRDDPWQWLRDDSRTNAEILDHLQRENAYTEHCLTPVAQLRKQLNEEMVERVIRDDESVPHRMGDYEYFSRVTGDQEYSQYLRRSLSGDHAADVILDANARAQDHAFYELGGLSVSDNHRWLAITEDTVGRRLYALNLIDLDSGESRSLGIEGISGGVVWSADSRFLFYVRKHAETLLPYQVWRHELGTDPANDVLCREETDSRYYTSVYRGTSLQTIYIHHGATLSDEVWWIRADEPESQFQVFTPRAERHEYSVDDRDGRYFVTSNRRHENFEVFEATLAQSADVEQWRTVIAGDDAVLVDDVELFAHHLVVAERRSGLPSLRVLPLDGCDHWTVRLGDLDASEHPCYFLDDNGVDQPALRFGVSSLTRPYEIHDLDLSTGNTELRKRARVGGVYQSGDYASERMCIAARDGVDVPVSLVYRRGGPPLSERPILVYGYGAYGSCVDPEFSASRLSLLDRDMIFAIAHIRGGEDLGRAWYHGGRKAAKPNTFNDFVDVTRALTKAGYGSKEQVFAVGGSAGGLLMGAIINQAPELYRGVVAQVPFVDVLTTMLDEDIPLTTGEFDEWGNPAIEQEYQQIAQWSPYDNVKAQAYPYLLVTSGLHDSQVQYWEPTKWVAKLRSVKTDNHLLLLHTEMEAGHGGVSGRYRQFEERALEYAFLLMLCDGEKP
ncbi:MAG: S9 family peptidase [Lysobacterales bacterium]